jgi:hypothetical protein
MCLGILLCGGVAVLFNTNIACSKNVFLKNLEKKKIKKKENMANKHSQRISTLAEVTHMTATHKPPSKRKTTT